MSCSRGPRSYNADKELLAWQEAGQVALEANNMPLAENLFSKMLAKIGDGELDNPTDVAMRQVVYFNYGVVLCRLGQTHKAREALHKAKGLPPVLDAARQSLLLEILDPSGLAAHIRAETGESRGMPDRLNVDNVASVFLAVTKEEEEEVKEDESTGGMGVFEMTTNPAAR